MHEQTYHAMYSREFLFGRWLWILTIAIIQERTFTLKQPFPTRTCEGQYESETQSPMLFPLFSSLTCHFVRLAGIIAPVLQKCLVIAKVMSTWQKSSKSHSHCAVPPILVYPSSFSLSSLSLSPILILSYFYLFICLLQMMNTCSRVSWPQACTSFSWLSPYQVCNRGCV